MNDGNGHSGDPLNDPTFPDRPTHPDFWRISDVLLQHDGDTVEGKQSIEQVCERLGIDVESLSYAAFHRIGNFLNIRGVPTTLNELRVVMMSAWVDAFAAGVAFNRKSQGTDQ